MILSLFLPSLNVSNCHIADSIMKKIIKQTSITLNGMDCLELLVHDDFVFDPRNFYSVFSLLYPGSYLEFTLLLN